MLRTFFVLSLLDAEEAGLTVLISSAKQGPSNAEKQECYDKFCAAWKKHRRLGAVIRDRNVFAQLGDSSCAVFMQGCPCEVSYHD